VNDDFVDANALAGPLAEVFAVDLTVAVAHCPSCEATVLRLVRGPDRIWLDLHGAASLETPLRPADTSVT
jgi:hypothetical protein